uniref:Uncharacterized protein n=1 Tax=Aegilops tauschii subsp. strangulata TaxID=200361 RepID=A0A453BPH5_AEGTS
RFFLARFINSLVHLTPLTHSALAPATSSTPRSRTLGKEKYLTLAGPPWPGRRRRPPRRGPQSC